MQYKVALVHDWLNGMRGGEKVLEEIARIFPQADIFTLFLQRENLSSFLQQRHIIPSSLNRNPLARRHYRWFLPYFPRTIEAFDLQDYDLVISSSHCVAKGIIPRPGARHFSYLHSPMRYAWDQYYSYFGEMRGWRKRYVARVISGLRTWDVASSARVDYFIANSSFVRRRIRSYYRRDAEVIHPPVDTDYFVPGNEGRDDYYLAVSALVPYKRIDLLIEACNQSRRRLVIVGRGPEKKRLQKMAGDTILFRENVSAPELLGLYQRSRGFLQAGVEDFGIGFVEALACGTPVIALAAGGVLDSVTDGVNGFLFPEQRISSLESALQRAEAASLSPQSLRETSLPFARSQFQLKMKSFLEGLSK